MKFSKIVTQDGFVTERMDVHANALLGNYDISGRYFINENIIKELMQMEKLKTQTYDNSIFCVANYLGIGELLFQIHYEKTIKNGKARSNIYLLEDVYKVNGYYINTIKTLIGSFEDVVDNYMEKSYNYYNLLLNEEESEREESLDVSDLGFPYIFAKKQYEISLFKNINKDMISAYKTYLDGKMTVIKGIEGDFSKNVLQDYENDLNVARDRFLTVKGDDTPKAFNELVDKTIENMVGVADSKKVEEYKSKMYEYTVSFAKEYNQNLEEATKKTKKHLSKDELGFVSQLEENLDLRNDGLMKISAWDCGFIDEFDIERDLEEQNLAKEGATTRKKSDLLNKLKGNIKNILGNKEAKKKKVLENNEEEKVEEEVTEEQQVINQNKKSNALEQKLTENIDKNDKISMDEMER